MVDQARVEAFVVQVGVARGLISPSQLQAAQSRSGGSLLSRLNPQLTPESRNVLQGLYHQALASEQAGTPAGSSPGASSPGVGPAAGTPQVAFGAEKTLAPSGPRSGGFVAAETYVGNDSDRLGVQPGPAADETYFGGAPDPEASAAGATPEATYMGSLPGRPASDRFQPDSTYASFVEAPTPATRSGESAPRVEPAPSNDATRAMPAQKPPTRVTGPAASARTVALPSEGETAAARPAALQPSGPAPTLGERVGAYETIRELGRGGMGIVYEARDTRTNAQVALKLMIVTRKTTEDDVSRFKIEAKAALKLDHPNLVRVFEQGVTEDGHWFTAMEFVPGEDLDQKMKREGILDSETSAEICLDLADALAYAHEQSVLHRDIKPQNVMIDEEGVPRLTDFGLAKLRDDDAKTSLTASGTLLGTPAYMSPEQATGEKRDVDERTDVYCLGATLYHMLTGKPPFERPSLTSLLLAITSEKPLPPTQLVADVDRDLETIVLKCIEKKREDRYASMRALARDLNRWTRALDIVAKRPSAAQNFAKWAAENRPLVGVIAGAAIVVLATLAFAFSRGPGPEVAGSPSPTTEPSVALKTEDLPTKTETKTEAKTEDPPAKTEAKTEDLPAKTEAKTEDLPAKTEVKTEDPPAKTEAKTEDPPAKTEVKTEDPPAKTEVETEDPHPKTEDRSPTPARGKVLPAAAPPTWLKRRLTHLRTSPGALFVQTWRDALAEAGARRAPILLVNLNHQVKTLTKAHLLATRAQIRRVNASCVVVIAQFPHPPEPGQPPPRNGRGRSDPSQVCPRFPSLHCVDHERLQARTVEPGWNEVQLRLYGSRGQVVLSESPNQKTGHQNNKRFTLSDASFGQALDAALAETGILLKADDLEGAGLDLSKADANRNRPRAEPVYARNANRPGPLGDWARLRLRELCAEEVRKAKGRRSRLDALLKRYRVDAGCLRLIDAAR